jgi:hypothetical protein
MKLRWNTLPLLVLAALLHWPSAGNAADAVTYSGDVTFNYNRLDNGSTQFASFTGQVNIMGLPYSIPVFVSPSVGAGTALWSDGNTWSMALNLANTVVAAEKIYSLAGALLSSNSREVYFGAIDFRDFAQNQGPTERLLPLTFPKPLLENAAFSLSFVIGVPLRYDVTIDAGKSVLLDQSNVILESLTVAGKSGTAPAGNLTICQGLVARDTIKNYGSIAVNSGGIFRSPVTNYGSMAFNPGGCLLATLTNAGSFEWQGGTIGRHDTPTLVTNTGTSFTISGSNTTDARVLERNATFRNTGTVTHQAGSPITLYGVAGYVSPTIENAADGLYNVLGDGVLTTSPAVQYPGVNLFKNAGAFRKSSGTGDAAIGGAVQFHNTGTIEVLSGSVSLGSGSNSESGRVVFANNSSLKLGGPSPLRERCPAAVQGRWPSSEAFSRRSRRTGVVWRLAPAARSKCSVAASMVPGC